MWNVSWVRLKVKWMSDTYMINLDNSSNLGSQDTGISSNLGASATHLCKNHQLLATIYCVLVQTNCHHDVIKFNINLRRVREIVAYSHVDDS